MFQKKKSSTARNWMVGFAIGMPISLVFAAAINPAFVGMGVAIGVSIAVALNEESGN